MKKRLLIVLTSVLFMAACGRSDGNEVIRFNLRDLLRVDVVSALPNETAVNVAYPIEYKFTNIGSYMLQELTFADPSTAQFTVDRAKSTCLASVSIAMKLHESCNIAGTFKAFSPNQYFIQSTANYPDGNPHSWVVSTQSFDVALEAIAEQMLPANISYGVTYPVAVRFTNTGSAAAHLGAFTVASTNNSFLTEVSNECKRLPNNILQGGKSCLFIGQASAVTAIGENDFILHLSYNTTQEVKFEASAAISSVVVVGAVDSGLPTTGSGIAEKVPVHTAIGETYPIQFTFTNQSATTAATGLVYTTDYPKAGGFFETVRTCGARLAPNTSCMISGNFIPTEANLARILQPDGTSNNNTVIGIALKYMEGANPVVTSTTTQVTARDVYPVTLTAADVAGVNPARTVFTFAQLNVKQTADGLMDRNAFLILPSVQKAITPQYVEEASYITQTIDNGELSDTKVFLRTDKGSRLQLNFRARRPSCFFFDDKGNEITYDRQLNDRRRCINGDTTERVVTVSIDPATWNTLPRGTHKATLRLSNIYHKEDYSGSADYSAMPIINFTISK